MGGDSREAASKPAGAVFLSYASQDADAAGRICEALRAAGVEVWFDQSELRGGDAWDRQIRKQIHDCALFVPIISERADARQEGYFRREWRLAVDRTLDMADDTPFLIPVVIDGTLEPAARVPDQFRAVQWTRLPAGETSAAFVERVSRLLSPTAAHAPLEARSLAASAPRTAAPVRQPARGPAARRRSQLVILVIAAAAAIGVGYFAVENLVLSKRVATASQVSNVQVGSFAQSAIPEKSIAVLPFVNMSSDKEQGYFSDGLSEELIDMLSRVPDLRVPARTSSFYFKGKNETIETIAKQLRVANLLEGSVRKAGDRLRVTAQLIRADNGYHLWSETYDRQLDDVFKVQDEIANAVVSALQLKLLEAPTTKDRQTPNTEAYNQYLIGRQLLAQDNWALARNAAEAFKRAVALDPSYAPAWAGLAEAAFEARNDSTSIAEGDAMTREAQAAADKAIALRPDLADGYVVRGYIRSWGQWDFQGAGEDFRRALALQPGNPDVLYKYALSVMMPTGRLDEAVANIDKVLQRDPLNGRYWRRLGIWQFYRGDYRAAREHMQRSLEITPEQSNTAAFLAYTYLLQEQPAVALPLSQRATSEVFRQQGGALAEYTLGHAGPAQRWLDELIAKNADGGAYQIAEVYAWRGDPDRAFEWLQRAYVQHDGGLTVTRVDPLLRNVRADSRYKALLHKLNLPE